MVVSNLACLCTSRSSAGSTFELHPALLMGESSVSAQQCCNLDALLVPMSFLRGLHALYLANYGFAVHQKWWSRLPFARHPPNLRCIRWRQSAGQEELIIGNAKIRAFDLGGHEAARKVWDTYFPAVDAVIYLVDSADRERFPEAKKELDVSRAWTFKLAPRAGSPAGMNLAWLVRLPYAPCIVPARTFTNPRRSSYR